MADGKAAVASVGMIAAIVGLRHCDDIGRAFRSEAVEVATKIGGRTMTRGEQEAAEAAARLSAKTFATGRLVDGTIEYAGVRIPTAVVEQLNRVKNLQKIDRTPPAISEKSWQGFSVPLLRWAGQEQDVILSAAEKRFVLATLANEPARPRCLAVLPDSEAAFTRVYGHVSGAELRSVRKAVDRLKAVNDLMTALKLDDTGGRQALEQQLDEAVKAGDNAVILLAHSEASNVPGKGRLLVLPNGDRIAEDEFHVECMRRGMRGYVLTCYGAETSTTAALRTTDAAEMIAAVAERLRDRRVARQQQPGIVATLNSAEVLTIMQSKQVSLKRQRTALSVVVASSAAGGGVTMIRWKSTDESDPPRLLRR